MFLFFQNEYYQALFVYTTVFLLYFYWYINQKENAIKSQYLFSGDHCSINIDECEVSNPCEHGVCRDLNGSYNCTCDKGYKGKNR